MPLATPLYRRGGGQVARADNARAALALVARGETPLGIVCRSDAMGAASSVRAGRPARQQPADSVAAMADSKHPARPGSVDFLKSQSAAPVFEHFGLSALD